MNDHIDLFSGIGGFTIAAQWAGFRTVGFCEREPFCQSVLRKHFPDVHIHGDIRELDGEQYKGVTLLTGGFPCQPFSVAGKRKGKEDDRYLWPEMLRIIEQAEPTWIIGENVAGVINMALDQVCLDLENKGYAVQPFVIPACAVNAPHRRDRVWIIANRKRMREPQPKRIEQDKRGWACDKNHESRRCPHCDEWYPESSWKWSGGRCPDCGNAVISHSKHNGRSSSEVRESDTSGSDSSWNYASNANGLRMEGERTEQQTAGNCGGCEEWSKNWHEVAAEFCRVDDGIPNRVDRLKSLGNAIVPQVAYEIMKSIQIMEKEME